MKNCFLFLLSFLILSQASAQNGTLRGKVVNTDGEPLPGATIYIPGQQKGAYTNESGIYAVPKLEGGTFEVWAIYFGYDTTKQVIELESVGTVTRGFVLQEKMVFTNEVTITGQQTGRINKTQVETGITSISPQEINLLPSLGSPDLAQYLQVLPGVVFTGDQGGQLYIRGGTPIQNMVLLDGMVIYSPFHSIGLFSVFDPDYIRNVDVYSAAFPGQYGGRISSVVDIKSRNGSFSKVKGKLNVNPFSSAVMLEGPLVKGEKPGSGVSFLISGRQNYIDQTSQSIYSYVNDSVGLPYNFQDLYGKLTLSDGINSANLFGFRHNDNVNFEFPADIGWEASGGGGNFQLLPAGAGAIISGSFAYSDYSTSLESAQSEQFPRNSSISGFSGGLKVGYIFNAVDELAFGTSFLGFQTDYQFTNSFGFQTTQQNSNTEAAIYLKYKKVLQGTDGDESVQRAVIEPSVHVHYYNNQIAPRFEPRLRAKFNFPRFSISAATGSYSQNLMAAVSDRDVVNLFQGFLSAPTQLPDRIKSTTLQTAWHALGGLEFELVENLTTNVEGWYKGFTQLTNINREKVFPDEPDFITETGKAYGFDVILKYQTANWYAYGTYGWAKVRRTDAIRTYAPVWDRRHNINAVLSYTSGTFPLIEGEGFRRRPKFTDRKWEVSVRWSLGSGFPFTQTQGYFEKLNFLDDGALTDVATQNGQLGIILSDELNGGRLPFYHRLDFSAKRRWLVSNAMLVEASASIVNVYNRNNIFYFDRLAFEPVYQLPFIPSLGITLKY
ncbi:MAG: carboxypeptidase-like regulatory domain-containing protein [Bacteroidota bacterium]